MTKVKDTPVEKESVTKPSNENVTPPVEDPNKIVMLGNISYTDEKQYEEWLSNMDINQAIFVLVASANYTQSKGVYSLSESELMSAAIRTIKKNSSTTKPDVVTNTNDESSK
jgi:CRISPR/Cas system CSM-associated protein Csm4 (group 5 of RAMP superfamily)